MLSVQMEQGKRLDRQSELIGLSIMFAIDVRDEMTKAGLDPPPLPEEFKNIGMD